MQKLISVIFILFVSLGAHAQTMDVTTDTSDIEHSLRRFCQSEFDGDDFEIRHNLVTFSSRERNLRRKTRAPILPEVMVWKSDPAVIVKSFEILGIKIVGTDKALGRVKFERIGRSEGTSGVIAEKKSNEIVEYILTKNDGRWMIEDPPKGRISKGALLSILKRELENHQDALGAKASAGQIKNIRLLERRVDQVNKLQ